MGSPVQVAPSKCSWLTVPPELLWKSPASQPLSTDVSVLAPHQGLELKESKSKGSRVLSTVSPKQVASGLQFGSILWVGAGRESAAQFPSPWRCLGLQLCPRLVVPASPVQAYTPHCFRRGQHQLIWAYCQPVVPLLGLARASW